MTVAFFGTIEEEDNAWPRNCRIRSLASLSSFRFNAAL